MSRIDVENAKQIRTPMDVLITMEVPATDITLTYSGYSSAKVADGILGESTWPMRLLADLKGDGFPLDGTRVVYDPNTTASATNGKIGVRSNIGQSVSVTVTGNRTISSLSIFATGAESVTYNGTTSAIVGGQVIIPVGATSITLTFNPASTTERIEVSEIVAGTTLRITNDTLIKAVVSLRSDLSIIDPTLPESELNVEVYNDADISEIVASLPEDTPITYQAGYEADMSPIRKFYVSGQVTWADNILSIHAVDAVHFLDKEMPAAFLWYDGEEIYRTLLYVTQEMCGIDFVNVGAREYLWGSGDIVFDKMSCRDVVKNITNLFRSANETRPFIPCYVDAGRPSFDTRPRQASATIPEEDCGDIKQNVDRTYSAAVIDTDTLTRLEEGEVGTFTWVKEQGAFLEIDEYVREFQVCFLNNAFPAGAWDSGGAYYVLPATSPGGSYAVSRMNTGAYWLFDGESSQGFFVNAMSEGGYVYTQVIPWDKYLLNPWLANSQAAFWDLWVSRGNIQAGDTNMQGVLWGSKYTKEAITRSISTGIDGGRLQLKIDGVSGTLTRDEEELYPSRLIKERLLISPITCSFTWKGDPRIQPRDVFTFHRLDGTDEDWTFENITLTHEKGGTVAEITARKGIV